MHAARLDCNLNIHFSWRVLLAVRASHQLLIHQGTQPSAFRRDGIVRLDNILGLHETTRRGRRTQAGRVRPDMAASQAAGGRCGVTQAGRRMEFPPQRTFCDLSWAETTVVNVLTPKVIIYSLVDQFLLFLRKLKTIR